MLFDVDFLERAHHGGAADMRPIIYVYRSGVLRSRMKKSVVALAARHGLEVGGYLPAEVTSYRPSGLLKEYRLCEWPTGRQPNETVGMLEDILSSGNAISLAVFTPSGGPLLRHAAWQAVEKHCLVLCEAEISERTLERYLRFCDRTTDLLPPDTLLKQHALRSYFEDISSGATISVAELMQRFDEIALTCIDSQTFELSPAVEDEKLGGVHTALLPALQDLVTSQKTWALIAIAQVMDIRQQQGRTRDQRHIELYQKTGALIRPKSQSMSEDASATDVLLWCAVLLAWDRRISLSGADGRRIPDLFGVCVDQMCRDFLMRSDSDLVDPLVGIWPLLLEALDIALVNNERGLPRVRRWFLTELFKASASLPSLGAPPWVGRFHGMIEVVHATLEAETIGK